MGLVIKGPIFTGGRLETTAVRIENGMIAAVGPQQAGPNDRVITLEPRELLLPAAIDTFCAMRDWGEELRDTVETVTRAALAGGVTVVCDQPNTVPRINSPELVRQRAEFVAARSYSDYGISGHPPADFARIDEYRDAGACSVAVFMWELRPWNFPRDIDDSTAQFRRYAELGLRGLVLTEEFGLRGTPLEPQGETYALAALLRRLDPDFEVRIAVTLPDSVERILAARERLPKALIQVAPHALFMSHELGFQRIGIAAAQTPPLRPAAEVERMLEFAKQSQIDVFMTHHCAHRTADKYNTEAVDGELTPKAGYSAIDFAYPLYLTKLGIEQACRGFCEKPAMVLGLKKGVIAPGYEADLVIVEQSAGVAARNLHVSGGVSTDVWRVEPGQFQSMGKVTPFVGERLNYRVRKTFLRGEEVYDAASGTFTRRSVRRVV